MSNYSITPVTKLFRENNIPTSPLRESRSRETGTYGNQIWIQTKDGYSWSKGKNSDYVWFFVRGVDVLKSMKDVIESNGYEVDYYQENPPIGGEMSVKLPQFYNE